VLGFRTVTEITSY